jgi:hypothetical protein
MQYRALYHDCAEIVVNIAHVFPGISKDTVTFSLRFDNPIIQKKKNEDFCCKCYIQM